MLIVQKKRILRRKKGERAPAALPPPSPPSLVSASVYLQVLVTKMFKVQIFSITEQNYILRNNSKFVSRRINIVHEGSESQSHLVPKLWRI